jgi:tetratricopeptide (TPR) repeat protein
MPASRIDDTTLRDEPVDRDEALRHVESLGPCGEKVVWLRMLGELDQAAALGWALLADAGGPATLAVVEPRRDLPVDAIAPAVRLAHVLQWQERFAHADALFAVAVASAERVVDASAAGSAEQRRATTLLAFAIQHRGKSWFDEGRLDDALESFRRALDLRERLDAPADQVASSRQAVAATLVRLAPPA